MQRSGDGKTLPIMLQAGETRLIKASSSILAKIKQYANGGMGIYAMNTPGANFYEFTLYKDQKGKTDWTGGKTWSQNSEHFDFVMNCKTGELTQKPSNFPPSNQ